MKNKFQFYEVVRVINCDQIKNKDLLGEEGTVLGMSQNEEDGHWVYAVSMPSTGTNNCIREDSLESTGRMKQRSDFYSGDSIRVIVDPETGEGSIKEDER